MYDVGGGHRLHLECMGSGAPVIVIDVGNDDTIHGSWDAVFTPMAAVSRVCAYDRANLGQSDADPGPRRVRDLGDDLLTLLHTAKVPGPYVFVGGSFGGNIAAVLADRHPDQVAGLVLVDSDPANKDPRLDPLRSNLTAAQYQQCCAGEDEEPAFDDPENREHIDFAGGLPDDLHSVGHLPRVPTRVLSSTRNEDCQADWPCAAIVAASQRLQALWLTGNPLGRQVIVDSGHIMQREAPDAIVEQTRAVVQAVRKG
jgi:pimeloyl-ACP methyl ester carboxylesterase